MLEKAFNSVMPFGIKLRSRGRYILSHKNSFLVRVQLLDNTAMECTLTVENTGTDCLHAVAKKLELNEVQYFGLKYYNKQMVARWVELDKPLKKQMDKNAPDPTLYFGVMFYVANLELLQQEITRYLFYLQLKNNVIDGCLPRSPDEAIELASYMIQAEFGDYNPKVHTVKYFRDFILFPEVMAPNEEELDRLTKETLTLHQRHRALTAPDAEYNYVLKVMHLNGYGEATYHAKDPQNTDYEIGCSFIGVVTREIVVSPTEAAEGSTGAPPPGHYSYGKTTWYEWNKVDQVLCNKSAIIFNLRKDELQFFLEDADAAKYAWRIFEMKRKFYTLNRENQKKLAIENGESTAIQRRPTLRRTPDTPLRVEEVHGGSSQTDQHSVANSQQPQEFISSQENVHTYGVQQQEQHFYSSQSSLDHAYVSQTSLNRVQPGIQQDYGFANGYMAGGSMYSASSINSLVQSQTRLNRPSPASSNLSLSSERHLASNGVPVYRCTPDYEQAVRQRRRYSSYLENQAIQQQATNNPTGVPDASRKPRPHSMIYSQQELLHQATHGPHYAQYPPHNPLMHHGGGTPQRIDSNSHLQSSLTQIHRPFEASHESLPPIQGNTQHSAHMGQYNPQDVPPHPSNGMYVHGFGAAPGNALLAASTPELAHPIHQVKGYSASEMQLLRHYTKPPPPYPRNNSTSTPDLSAHRNSAVSASSPDLHHGFNMAQGPRRPPLHPVPSDLAENGYPVPHGMQAGNSEHYRSQEQVTVIRGMCTSVEGIPQAQQVTNYGSQQLNQTPHQNVQAYLQHLTIEQQPNPARTRHQGQQPHPRHHRPVSYPPRLNHNHPVLMGVEEQLTPVPQNLLSSESHLSSSTSTVGSPYGSQQYLHHGSQVIIQRSQLAPASHAVMIQQPMPQHADTTLAPQVDQYRGQVPLHQQMHPVQVGPESSNGYREPHQYDPHLEIESKQFDVVTHHSQMPSNATMLIHSSGSERDSDDEDSMDEEENVVTSYKDVPLTTIEPKKQPTEMYVPPKPRTDPQQYPIVQQERPPPPYQPSRDQTDSEEEDFVPPQVPNLPLVGSEDHDPPISYRKPYQIESYDEGDPSTLSVFPHPNPSNLHNPQLSETNPFFVPSMSKNNPFYPHENVPQEASDEEDTETFANAPFTANVDETKLFADATSEGLRHSRRSLRKSALKFSVANGDILNPPSPSAGAPDERVLELEKQVEDGQVLTEYEKIPRKRNAAESLSGDPAGDRDRVKSVVPYPENRVQLRRTAVNPDGYVNASYVKVDVAEQTWSYILCQSPMDEFLEEFWEMIWSQEVSIIAMISKEVEDGRVRCGRYWPELSGDPSALLFGNFRVCCEIISDSQPPTPCEPLSPVEGDEEGSRPRSSSNTCEHLVTSRLVLQKAGTTECRKVWHLQYVGWPDTGAPKDPSDFLAFMEELESVRRLADDNLSESEVSPPVVVHCPSGAGRSGVLVLSDLMRHSLEHNKDTTVPDMLRLIRDQRMHAVQTVSQYNFVYQVLILFLKNSRLI